MSGVLSSAISGLQASQIALRTAGNNIANANTQGYSRQTVDFSTRPELQFGNAGYLGNGVNTESVSRVVNEFVTTQLRLDTATFNQLDTFNTNIGKVDKLFSDVTTGLIGGFQNFFAALQNGANDPSATPARQLILTQADSLAVRYNGIYSRLVEAEKAADSEIKTVVQQIGALAKSIANLNQSLMSNSSSLEAQPNAFLDQRDEALRKLSELTSVQVVKSGSGEINVFIGSGEPLVVGPVVSSFRVESDGKVMLVSNDHASDVSAQVSGGKLGGLMGFKNTVLKPSINELGRIAIVMSDVFNKVQSQGLDMNGNYGSPMFSDINEKSLTYARVQHGNNAPPGDRVISVNIADTKALTISDYKFEVAAGTSNYTITRLSDNATIEQGLLPGGYPVTIKFDGLELNLESGSFQSGDSFILQPTRRGADNIKSLLTAPESLAFASPIRTGSAAGNTGKGAISAGEVLGMLDANGNPLATFATAGKLSPPLVIRFTSDTTYEVLDNTDPSNPVPLNPPMREQIFLPNRENNIFSADIKETRISGDGARLGLPAGRTAIPSLLFPAAVYPDTLTTKYGQPNGYPVEQYTFRRTDPATGLTTTQTMATSANASAAETAARINTIAGASARAFTTATITDINIDPAAFTSPFQISVNGENLVDYSGLNIAYDVPNPNDEVAFNDYLVERINSNDNLKALGIRAESSNNPITGVPEIHLVASSGVNLDIRLTASAATNNSISVSDSNGNPNVRLSGQDIGGGEQSAVTVGGRIDITLSDGTTMTGLPEMSQILGDTTAADFALPSYLGFQVKISGEPKAGDIFTIGFNTNSRNDNRNALAMVALETAGSMQNGTMSFGQGYGRLVEEVGTKSNLSKINTDAARSLLEQTTSMRDGVSGVNLDEEAANLIQFQQLYTANARVITVAKDLFDTLIGAL
jgi:flagellar hook-associated protein 1